VAHVVTIKDAAGAAATEQAAAMPSPQTAARRGIIVGRYMGLGQHQAALMVMVACGAATSSAAMDGVEDTSWLESVHDEAMRVYERTRPADIPS
jgi:hypothetical protein